MIVSKQLRLKLVAFLLLTLLLLPIMVQLLHSFENHRHISCGEVKIHLHEKNIDCSIGDFHFSTFTFILPFFLDQVVPESFSKNQIDYFSSEIIIFQDHIFQRGPPAIS
jgi:hypothetical protein